MATVTEPMVTGQDIRKAFGLRPEPVCAITTCDEWGERIGMTATAVSSVSLEPPMLLICVKSGALIASAMRAGMVFVVHFLTAEQEEIARRLAAPIEDKFQGVSHRMSSTGAARLDESGAILECEPAAIHEAGDHIIVIGHVTRVDLAETDAAPLLFHAGAFTTVRDRAEVAPTLSPTTDTAGATPPAGSEKPVTKVLMVVTGASAWTLSNGSAHPTGFWAEELIAPHKIFNDVGWELDIATPGGVKPTVDQNSLTPEYTGADEAAIAELRQYLESIDGELSGALALESINPADYDILFAPGGHGPMEDLAVLPAMGDVIVSMLDAEKLVAAVCHASAALLSADRPDGSWALEGYRVTGFTNAEEEAVGLAAVAPWLLETRLRERGGVFESGEMWAPFIVSDRNLHSGQNPASSGPLAEHLVAVVGAGVA
jgi:flavin reductase (DIM6/NTAB) family NADH-FMN oxidoreductase RutF/putative intracellular protease/amidase